ncbi:hypothetical protein [Segatella hominis]|nr:hypothetical protein [Segatella hominis]
MKEERKEKEDFQERFFNERRKKRERGLSRKIFYERRFQERTISKVF